VGDIVPLNARHPLVGTWRDKDHEWGSTLQFVVSALGSGFQVRGIDTHDGEELEISSVQWDGRALRFLCLVRSTGRRIEYELRAVSGSEASLHVLH